MTSRVMPCALDPPRQRPALLIRPRPRPRAKPKGRIRFFLREWRFIAPVSAPTINDVGSFYSTPSMASVPLPIDVFSPPHPVPATRLTSTATLLFAVLDLVFSEFSTASCSHVVVAKSLSPAMNLLAQPRPAYCSPRMSSVPDHRSVSFVDAALMLMCCVVKVCRSSTPPFFFPASPWCCRPVPHWLKLLLAPCCVRRRRREEICPCT